MYTEHVVNEGPWPSGKAVDCRSTDPGFDSRRALFFSSLECLHKINPSEVLIPEVLIPPYYFYCRCRPGYTSRSHRSHSRGYPRTPSYDRVAQPVKSSLTLTPIDRALV